MTEPYPTPMTEGDLRFAMTDYGNAGASYSMTDDEDLKERLAARIKSIEEAIAASPHKLLNDGTFVENGNVPLTGVAA